MQIIYRRNAQPDHWPVARDYGAVSTVADALAGDLADVDRSRLLLDFETWREHYPLIERMVAERRDAPIEIGVVMATTVDPAMLDDRLHSLSLIKVAFDQFTDGRGFSIASILRTRIGLDCELRATNVVRENLAMLERCGYDSYELIDQNNINQAVSAFDELSVSAA